MKKFITCLLVSFLLLLTPYDAFAAAKTGVNDQDVGYENALNHAPKTFTSATITQAIADIAGARRILYLEVGTWAITTNVTVPSTIILWIPAGTVVNISAGITLTVNGRLRVDGPNVSPFTGSGTVTVVGEVTPIPYSASMAVDCSLGPHFSITATNSTAFTLLNPTGCRSGQELSFTLINGAGGALGAATFSSQYELGATWAQPASGFSRTITFLVTSATQLREKSRTPDVSTGGNVSASGTPTSGQSAEWISATQIIGVAVTGTGIYVKQTSPVITTPFIASFINATHTHTNPAGGGTLPEAALALTDITTNDATSARHGFLPKLPGGTTTFLNANGAFSTPAGGGNVSNTGTPTPGQLALWTSATVLQGLTLLPAANFPALTGDCTTSAGALAVTCTKLNGLTPFTSNPQTATYQVLAADFDGYKTIPVASNTFTITLVASGTQPANGKYIKVINYGTGIVTITRSGQNINGGTASIPLPAGSALSPTSAFIVSDGTNYFAAISGTNPDTVKTLTNTTLDVEASGNSITTVSKVWLGAASCQGTNASLLWDTPVSAPPVATCMTGTNTQKGVADFADGANLSMQQSIMLPSDWSGAIDARFKWLTSAITGAVVWQIATICVADAETDDPAFNTSSTVTDTAKGTTLQTNDAIITGITTTGCAAGELMHLKVFRDSANGADTLAGTASLIGIELSLRRTQ